MKNCRIQHFVGVFMTLLMVSYLACLSLCLHTHVVDNKVFTHSHPYKTSSHTHSGIEFVLLKSLSDFTALTSDVNADVAPYFSLFCGAIIKLNASSFDASILYSGRVAGPQLPVPVPFVKPLRVTKVVFWS